jgi:DNA-binding CsgD family transcriptional regulator
MARKNKNENETNFLGAEGAELEAAETPEQEGAVETEGQEQSVYIDATASDVPAGDVETADTGAAGEVTGEGAEFDGSAPSTEEAASEAADDRIWTVDGATVSKSEFIRHKFTKEDMGRKEISEKYGINYRTVYGATMNMVNGAEASTRGRTASATKILITADNRVVSYVKDAESGAEILHINNAAVDDDALVTTPAVLDETTGEEVTPAVQEELTEVDRNTWIKQQVAAGVSRGDIASALGLSYGVIYGITKDSEGSSNRHEVEVKDAEGNVVETISRSEHIRRLFATGKTKAEIAKELGVDYPIVWAALKGLKPESEKFTDAIDKLEKFADQVENVEAFNALIGELRAISLKEPVEETAEAETTEEAPATEAEPQDEVVQAEVTE